MSKRLSDAEKLELKRILARGGIGSKLVEQLDADDDKLDEDIKYVMMEMRTFAKGLDAVLAKKAETEDLKSLSIIVVDLMTKVEQMLTGFTVLESNVNKIKEGLLALAEKLDDNANVAETDHKEVVLDKLT